MNGDKNLNPKSVSPADVDPLKKLRSTIDTVILKTKEAAKEGPGSRQASIARAGTYSLREQRFTGEEVLELIERYYEKRKEQYPKE